MSLELIANDAFAKLKRSDRKDAARLIAEGKQVPQFTDEQNEAGQWLYARIEKAFYGRKDWKVSEAVELARVNLQLATPETRGPMHEEYIQAINEENEALEYGRFYAAAGWNYPEFFENYIPIGIVAERRAKLVEVASA